MAPRLFERALAAAKNSPAGTDWRSLDMPYPEFAAELFAAQHALAERLSYFEDHAIEHPEYNRFLSFVRDTLRQIGHLADVRTPTPTYKQSLEVATYYPIAMGDFWSAVGPYGYLGTPLNKSRVDERLQRMKDSFPFAIYYASHGLGGWVGDYQANDPFSMIDPFVRKAVDASPFPIVLGEFTTGPRSADGLPPMSPEAFLSHDWLTHGFPFLRQKFGFEGDILEGPILPPARTIGELEAQVREALKIKNAVFAKLSREPERTKVAVFLFWLNMTREKPRTAIVNWQSLYENAISSSGFIESFLDGLAHYEWFSRLDPLERIGEGHRMIGIASRWLSDTALAEMSQP